jgi:nitrate reductase delta subunit
MMASYAWLAEAFRYPVPGKVESLRTSLIEMSDGPVKKACASFLRGVEQLPPSEWEELYTRTLDLNPSAAPYVGFQTWGENYQRGRFMASLNQAFQPHSIDLDGELPDHIVPILRYLEVAPYPLPELEDVLEPAIQRMAAVLRKTDPGNPYLDLFEAVLHSLAFSRVHAS